MRRVVPPGKRLAADKSDLTKKIPEQKCGTSRDKITRLIIHEIRNPLSAISLANQLMDDAIAAGQVEPESIRIYTEIIARNVAKIETQLQELLLEKKDEVTFRRVRLGEIIDESITHATDRIQLQEIRLHKLYSGRESITGNSQLLSVVFLNLLVNAIEAFGPKGGEIWISVYQRGEKTEVTFRDNGRGMKEEHAKRIFDPHYSSKPKGLGMGLAHVKTILEEHHAAVMVETAPGKGTAFIIEFNT